MGKHDPGTPVDRRALDAALQLFTTTFVVADKRKQLYDRLLAADRRAETLATLPRWIATSVAPLQGADRSPDGLRKRFGELIGIHLAESPQRTTIARALELGRAMPSLFIADSGNVALITMTDGELLCSRF